MARAAVEGLVRAAALQRVVSRRAVDPDVADVDQGRARDQVVETPDGAVGGQREDKASEPASACNRR